ncbi:hypothetical protein SCB49_09070 [unidentified eubacterium SCB49]|nr:hypothetical protein SCB49_09070 [unidentified eubacterium SCB49]
MKNSFLLTLFAAFMCSTSLFAQKYDFGKVSVAELEQTAHPVEPDANAAILFREEKTMFKQTESTGFYIETEVFERIKIYNKDGFDYATKMIRVYQTNTSNDEEVLGLKAQIFSLVDGKVEKEKLKNSSVFEEKVSDYTEITKFTMPNVKPGDVIDIKYTLKSPFYYNIDEYQLQDRIPVDRYKMSFAAPEYFSYQMHQKGFIDFKVATRKNDRSMNYSYIDNQGTGRMGGEVRSGGTIHTTVNFVETIYSIDKTGIPSMKREPLSGNINNYIAGLKLELSSTNFPNSGANFYTTSWDDVCKNIYESSGFGGELQKTGFLKNEVSKIIGNASSNEEKMIAAFEYVKKNTTWDEYYGYYVREGIRAAYKNGKGNAADINLLLVAVLREAGINANPILVSTISNGISTFPTRDGFNFVVCGVEVANNVVLLDATRDSAPNILNPQLLNWQGRLIRNDGSSTWVPLVPSKPAVTNSMLMYTINDDHSISGKMQKRYTGHKAAGFRDNYKGLTEDATRKQMEEDLGDTELDEIAIKFMDDVYKPAQYSTNFENTSAVEEIGDKLYLSPLLFLASDENIFKAETRNLPIYFGYPVQSRSIATITLPEGYKVETMPESINVSLDETKGAYKYVISEKGGKIQLSVDSTINQPVFSNADYGNLKRFFEMIVKKETEKVVLTKI